MNLTETLALVRKHGRDDLTADVKNPDAVRGMMQRLGLGVCTHCGRLAKWAGCLDRTCLNNLGTVAIVHWQWGRPSDAPKGRRTIEKQVADGAGS